MHLKASKCFTVIVLYVSFPYPVVSVRRSIRFKLNQMSPVVVLVHVARLSKCGSDRSCALMPPIYMFLDGFGEPSVCTFGCVLLGSLGLRDFPISPARQLFYDFASWSWLLIRDNQLTVGTFVKVVILGLALCNHSVTKKKGETKCKIQICISPRVSDLLVYFSMVSVNVCGETGFIK
jgi:hypothetical protein